MIVRIWEVKRVAFYARAETVTEAVASAASMVATPLVGLVAQQATTKTSPCSHVRYEWNLQWSNFQTKDTIKFSLLSPC